MRNISLIILLFGAMLFNSCSVDNLEPTGFLTESMLITNEESARAVLNQIYSYTRSSNNELGELTLALSLAGIEQKPAANETKSSFYQNNVLANRGVQVIFYQSVYKTINLVNLFMRTTKDGVKGLTEDKLIEMWAEAKGLRANAYFSLLRIFGQFYDSKSIYGLATTKEVIGGYTELKRSTVEETYKLIIEDLEFAIKYAPENKPRFYFSKVFAEALMAKVYLSKGGNEAYLKAIKHCENVFAKEGERFRLVDDYPSIFQDKFNSPELLFAPLHKKKGVEMNSIPFSPNRIKPSDYIREIADEQDGVIGDGDTEKNSYGYDPRFVFTYEKKSDGASSGGDENDDNEGGGLGDIDGDIDSDGQDGAFTGVSMGNYYNKYTDDGAPYYYMRMAEVYLIYAEALARTGGSQQKALGALNKIRERAGVPSKTYKDTRTFLEDVRIEKLIELSIENGEPWFDLVRYDRLGNLKAKDLKPTITNPDKLIFPIPLKAIENNREFGPNNPGY